MTYHSACYLRKKLLHFQKIYLIGEGKFIDTHCILRTKPHITERNHIQNQH